jgi:hypothetical protein
MPKNWRGRADLAALLDAVQAASPVNAVEVLARELGRMLAATEVRFLIADLSGNTLISFVPSPGDSPAADDVLDHVVRVPLAGSLHDQALTAQRVVVEQSADGERLFAPVTDRGDAIGVLELVLPPGLEPQQVSAMCGFVASAAGALAYVIILARGRDTAPAAAGLVHLRGGRVHPGGLAGAVERRGRGHLRLQPRGPGAAPVDQ